VRQMVVDLKKEKKKKNYYFFSQEIFHFKSPPCPIVQLRCLLLVISCVDLLHALLL
jgi:hypothetical protein